ncbi:hypothetical protein AXF42_Ash012181 [Apostasia shenzhenica]|uniref:BED-type domain-containing protein n=1 Tax=Apostasia shenzhenica TaxID=1088818 RepID=A0A2I0B479_9ASPA|nr:hypothetical protein AXF42_Ash012181 [Apostasia shenzhenica]
MNNVGDKGGGNVIFQCTFCNMQFKETYYRVKAHLLKLSGYGIKVCAEVIPQILVELQKVVSDAEERHKSNQPKRVFLPSSINSREQIRMTSRFSMHSSTLRIEGVQSKKMKTTETSSSIMKAFNMQVKDTLDDLTVIFFYSTRLSFPVARNSYFIESIVFAALNNCAEYVLPGYNNLTTTCLQK